MSGTAFPPPFPKGAIINDGNILVDPAALGHEKQFEDGIRKPTEADIRRIFRINAKLKSPTREPNGGTWKWEDWAEDVHAKPPRRRKNNLMCFSVVNAGTQYKVFHYHKGFYDT